MAQGRLARVASHLTGGSGTAPPQPRSAHLAVVAPAGSSSSAGNPQKVYAVCMLGARARATSAARAYHAHPRCRIAGVCDLVEEHLHTLSDELGVPPQFRYDDLDRMIDETAPDIVAIPVGTELHYPLSMRVLQHGVSAIDVEKPLCETLE